MGIKDFLLARIAEDEADLKEPTNADYCDDLSGRHYTNERILAECAAKRATIGRYVHSSTPNAYDLALLDVMRDLASVYADHPDYRQEWAA